MSGGLDDRTWDHVVVGAGSAGAVVANRLSEDPDRSVLLLEAGPDYRSAEAPPELQHGHWAVVLDLDRFGAYQWPALTARRTPSQQPARYWRGRGVGGSSMINGQVAIRPPLEDFERWVDAGGPQWSPEAVLGSFVAMEDDLRFGDRPYHGRGGPIPISRAPVEEWGDLDLAFRDAWAACGQPWMEDINEPGTTGLGIFAYNARDERRISTNEAYLEPARERPNLRIAGDVLVDRVCFEGDRAVGVSVVAGGRRSTIRASGVVLSAGAVHTPAILLRSGVGPAADLGRLGIPVVADLPVGHGFQEHPHLYFGFALRDGLRPAVNDRHTNACLRWSSGLAGTGVNDLMGMINAPPPGAANEAGLGLWVNQVFSRGQLRLVSSDPGVDPIIDMHLGEAPEDRERLRSFPSIAAEVLAQPGLAAVIDGPVTGLDGTPLAELRDRATIDAWIDRTVDGSAHASCTCAMGPVAAGGVVDGEGRVHGLSGLRVIDMSITPAVPRANTNLTAIMLAERLASVLGDGS